MTHEGKAWQNAYKNGLQPQPECKDVWFRYVWGLELSALLKFSFVYISLEGHQQLTSFCVPVHALYGPGNNRKMKTFAYCSIIILFFNF